MKNDPSFALRPHSTMKPQGPVLVCVLDGIGLGRADKYNAWFSSSTPYLDRLLSQPGRFASVRAHGTAVGLPSDADMGNSEVGHNALGCGRVIEQGAALVNAALTTGAIFDGAGWKYLRARFAQGGTLHLLGLLSDGGVHSRLDQVFALLLAAARDGAERIRMHILTDGRDVPDHSALHYIEKLEDQLAHLRAQGVDARIASGGGRMHVTMDRYEADWSVVERGWWAHVLGEGPRARSAAEAIKSQRDSDKALSDQYLRPFVIEEAGRAVGTIEDGDAVLCFNYRGDRVLEISRAFEAAPSSEFDRSAFDRKRVPDVHYVGMMEYDGDLACPAQTLVAPPDIDRTSGEYLVHNGVRTLAISETHKFGHVTYFWNGNRSEPLDSRLETFVEVPSDKRAFVDCPEMKAAEIADVVVKALASAKYDQVRVNLANGDMIGHTGDLEATKRACAVVDEQLGRMLAALEAARGSYLVTADHGNAEDMAQRDKDGRPTLEAGEAVPKTSHTLAPVPVCVGGPALGKDIVLHVDAQAGLPNLTATYLNLLGFEAPRDYAKSLFDDGRSRFDEGKGPFDDSRAPRGDGS